MFLSTLYIFLKNGVCKEISYKKLLKTKIMQLYVRILINKSTNEIKNWEGIIQCTKIKVVLKHTHTHDLRYENMKVVTYSVHFSQYFKNMIFLKLNYIKLIYLGEKQIFSALFYS